MNANTETLAMRLLEAQKMRDLGEDTDFQSVDDSDLETWRILFDACGMPPGRPRADLYVKVHSSDPNFEGCNISHAYAIGDHSYDRVFDTPEEGSD